MSVGMLGGQTATSKPSKPSLVPFPLATGERSTFFSDVQHLQLGRTLPSAVRPGRMTQESTEDPRGDASLGWHLATHNFPSFLHYPLATAQSSVTVAPTQDASVAPSVNPASPASRWQRHPGTPRLGMPFALTLSSSISRSFSHTPLSRSYSAGLELFKGSSVSPPGCGPLEVGALAESLRSNSVPDTQRGGPCEGTYSANSPDYWFSAPCQN